MSHEYERFITTVQQKARLSWEEAERAARATLETLAERLSAGQARDLAGQLPTELSAWLFTDSGPEPYHVDEFLRRVAAREHTDVRTAEHHARAVFTALGRTVRDDEIADMVAELPQDFLPLTSEAERREVGIMSLETFLDTVADVAGVDADTARRATDAVLETLAERIAGGEVEDLISRLPVELHEPLRRGDDASNGAAARMSLDTFLRHVAEREGVDLEQAREHTRAVFAALREAVGEKEFSDVTAQLPNEFIVVEARP
jgi:uncharacterized protein (DUF2267 family)